MLTFNALLRVAGLEPDAVRLVRHRHSPPHHRVMVQDAIRQHPRFDSYQRGQAEPGAISLLSSAEIWASFVAMPRAETLFVGLWQVNGHKRGFVQDPYRLNKRQKQDASVVFDLERMEALQEYVGRILVDWGGGERAWVQYASRRDKRILEIKRRAEEPVFPGFSSFSCSLGDLDVLPETWASPLRSTRGVYLVVHRETGAQYVGIAVGEDGFLGRWKHYADGHGGNVGLRELQHDASQYDVSILETLGSAATLDDACRLESRWKAKLGSRVHGLNRN